MKKILLTFILLYSLNISSQIKFEKGYFIKNDNIKIECLIKNKDWIGTPYLLEYKLDGNETIEKINTNEIKAFKIYDSEHYYQKKTFTIDENTRDISEKIINVTKLLKVLVEGDVSLYEYEDNIFLYEKDKVIKQLLYKKFVNDNKIQENFAFRKEIFDNLNCRGNKIDIRKLNYDRKELVAYIKKYHECQNLDYAYYGTNKTKSKFNFKVLAGVNFYNMKSKVGFVGYDEGVSFNNEKSSVNTVFGFETEFLLPFNHNKWSIFLAPNYQQHDQESSERKTNLFGGYNGILEMKDNYSYIELPIGIRKYFQLSNKSKIFAEGSYSIIFYTDKTTERAFYPDINYSVPLVPKKDSQSSPIVIRMGIGYNYNDRYYLSLNYTPVKTLSQSDVNSFSILASYRIF